MQRHAHMTCMLLLLAACESDDGKLPRAEHDRVARAVDSAMQRFEAAQRGLDADGAVALMAPDFFMYTDGTRQEYDAVVQNIRRSFASFRHVEPGFRDVHIRPLSTSSALASFRFRDSLVAASGAIVRFTGATTLLWEHRDGRWLMTYGHADHHPAE